MKDPFKEAQQKLKIENTREIQFPGELKPNLLITSRALYHCASVDLGSKVYYVIQPCSIFSTEMEKLGTIHANAVLERQLIETA